MSVTVKRLLCLWIGLLAILLCAIWLPAAPIMRGLYAALALLLTLGGWLWVGKSTREDRAAMARFDALPPARWTHPVVWVLGDDGAALFGEHPQRQTAEGLWLRGESVATFSREVQALLSLRPGWSGQISLFYVVNPQQQQDVGNLTALLRELRHQMACVARCCGRKVNLVLGCYLHVDNAPDAWFWQANAASRPEVWLTGQHSVSLRAWQQQGDVAEQSRRYGWETEWRSLHDWIAQHVLPPLDDAEQHDAPLRPVGVVMALTPALAVSAVNSLWQQWLMAHTTLPGRATPAAGTLRFPDPLFPLLPAQYGFTPMQRATVYAIGWFALAGGLALLGSAANNRQLIRQIADDLRRYQAVAMNDHPRKVEVLMPLQNDARQLNDWYRHGVPLRLGLGLYQEIPLRNALLTAIAGYQPPPPPPKPITTASPTTVRLDSLSLFDTGSATLKPGSTKVLINALVDSKARPGWLILIAGHTDSTGDAERNQRLSQARALAVRDWMITTSDIPETCFAVQGYGATRPVASNETAEGRAQNRRVEISLVPDAAACLNGKTDPIASEGDEKNHQQGD